MKIALIGAGAVGAYFIWGFENQPEVTLTVIADGERKERLKAEGVYINGEVHRPAVAEPVEAGAQDLILVATKYDALDAAIELIKPMIDDNTIVLSLLNGVDSEARIASAIGWAHVRISVMRIASRRDKEGIHFDPEFTMGVYVGKDDLPEHVVRCFDASRINLNRIDDIVKDMWIKYASNIANNLPQAVLGVDASLYIDSVHGRHLAECLWREVYLVAKGQGIDIGEKAVIFVQVPKTSKYSTLQDLEAGRHTEIDMFAGQMMSMAKAQGIEVPYIDYTYHAIKALEEKNDGIINH